LLEWSLRFVNINDDILSQAECRYVIKGHHRMQQHHLSLDNIKPTTAIPHSSPPLHPIAAAILSLLNKKQFWLFILLLVGLKVCKFLFIVWRDGS
jgi:hypothetical protein